jgi:hypothetical protein
MDILVQVHCHHPAGFLQYPGFRVRPAYGVNTVHEFICAGNAALLDFFCIPGTFLRFFNNQSVAFDVLLFIHGFCFIRGCY